MVIFAPVIFLVYLDILLSNILILFSFIFLNIFLDDKKIKLAIFHSISLSRPPFTASQNLMASEYVLSPHWDIFGSLSLCFLSFLYLMQFCTACGSFMTADSSFLCVDGASCLNVESRELYIISNAFVCVYAIL